VVSITSVFNEVRRFGTRLCFRNFAIRCMYKEWTNSKKEPYDENQQDAEFIFNLFQ